VYWEDKLLDKIKTVLARKKEKEKIFFSVFPRDQRHVPNYPALNMYVVDYKSMIGGYRTVFVMNTVNMANPP
jgi:hypothetical protein